MSLWSHVMCWGKKCTFFLKNTNFLLNNLVKILSYVASVIFQLDTDLESLDDMTHECCSYYSHSASRRGTVCVLGVMVMTEHTRAGEHTVRLTRSVMNTSDCSFVNSGVWWFPILLHEIPSFSLTLFRMVLFSIPDSFLPMKLQILNSEHFFSSTSHVHIFVNAFQFGRKPAQLQSWGGMYSGLINRHLLKIVGSFFFSYSIQINKQTAKLS